MKDHFINGLFLTSKFYNKQKADSITGVESKFGNEFCKKLTMKNLF